MVDQQQRQAVKRHRGAAERHYYRGYQRRRTRMMRAGTWQSPMPVTQVRQHLLRLRRQRMSVAAIARASGVSNTAVATILRSSGRRCRGVTQQIVRGPTATALLAVQPCPSMVPVAEIRPVVEALLRKRMTVLGIAEASGVSHGTIRAILGKGGQRMLRDTVTSRVAEALRAVGPTVTPPSGHVDAAGVMRRTRAMAWMGYPVLWQAKQAGCGAGTLSRISRGESTWVTEAVADAVAGLYRRVPAVGHCRRTADRAKALGWHGPGAWDMDTIDDPRVGAALDAPLRQRSLAVDQVQVHAALAGAATFEGLTMGERIEVVTILVARGWSHGRIGDFLHWRSTVQDRRGNAAVARFCVQHSISMPTAVKDTAAIERQQIAAATRAA